MTRSRYCFSPRRMPPRTIPRPKACTRSAPWQRCCNCLKLPDQTVRVLVEGKARARVTGFSARSDFFQANVEKIAEESAGAQESEALMRTVKANFEQYIKLNKKIPSETLAAVAQIDDPAKLADTVASHLSVKIGERQSLLETFGTIERLEKILSLIEAEIGVLAGRTQDPSAGSSARWRRPSANII